MLNREGFQQRFAAAQASNEFEAATTSWHHHGQRITACIFYRPTWRTRVPACSIALYGINECYVAVEKTLDDAVAAMQRYGYAGEDWQGRARSTYHQYIAASDGAPLWQAGYGVVRELASRKEGTTL